MYYKHFIGIRIHVRNTTLILLLIGVIPTWPHSRSWGYAPSGVLGVVVIILIVLLLLGRI